MDDSVHPLTPQLPTAHSALDIAERDGCLAVALRTSKGADHGGSRIDEIGVAACASADQRRKQKRPVQPSASPLTRVLFNSIPGSPGWPYAERITRKTPDFLKTKPVNSLTWKTPRWSMD